MVKALKKNLNWKSLWIGLTIGIVTELVNLFPHDGTWGLSSIAGSFGFWIFSTTLVIFFSRSNLNACLNTFFYLGGMCNSYYLLQGIIDFIAPNRTVWGFVQWDHLIFWMEATVLCAIVAFVLYYWNAKNPILNSFLCGLPVAGMLSDTINNAQKYYYANEQLMQLILDVIFLMILLVLFFRKSRNKIIYLAIVGIVAVIGLATGALKSNSITMQTHLYCEVNGTINEFYIQMRDDGVILEKQGDDTIYDAVGIDDCKSLPEVVHAFQNYYEAIGGICTTENND